MYMSVLSSYTCDHAVSLTISGAADLSSAFKCLASGKKPIELLHPANFSHSATSAYFSYITVHYTSGMLILSHAHGLRPTPPGGVQLIPLIVIL